MTSHYKQAAIVALILIVGGIVSGLSSVFVTLGLLSGILAAMAAFPLSSQIPKLRGTHAVSVVLSMVAFGIMQAAGIITHHPLMWAGGLLGVLSLVFASVMYDARKHIQPQELVD